ncbi:protein MAIN-LIKE 1-like [Iris pallida]|uniref:Protein MAIN-LIKE 1-like n=1 Tax=Iris pallida TaxID=29817 RepID=A0AAX6GSM0_IRIPA|nr:protein MAIN-LIKE 1-like [Iris pallida]
MSNDGRISGGPTTEFIRKQRKNHISDKIFTGQLFDHDLKVRLREHGSWRKERKYNTWVLNDAQKALVRSFGFQYLDQIKFLTHDVHLILSLAERWWPERNTFQLPVGEMTITLCDVANILELPITGDPIYFNQQSTPSDLITTYLGIMPPSDLRGNSCVTFSWLRGSFMDLNHTMDNEAVEVDDIRIIQCTRAYLLALCGAILFSDANGNKVNVRLLPFLADLTKPTSHAWGAAALSFLYAMLTEFANMKTTQSICGCMSLVQVWSYEHFYIGRPVTSVASNFGVFPITMRWSTDVVDQQHCQYKAVSLYREQFDTLEHSEVSLMRLCSVIPTRG